MKDSSIWIGLLLSLPLSVLANVATPWLIRLLSHFSKRVRDRQARRASERQAEIEWYEENRYDYIAFLIRFTGWTVIFIILYATITILGMGFVAASVGGAIDEIPGGLWIASALAVASFFCAFMSMLSMTHAGRIYRGVSRLSFQRGRRVHHEVG